jgi:hypothetical protein
VEPAEAEVAVSDERTHAEIDSEHHCSGVASMDRLGSKGCWPHRVILLCDRRAEERHDFLTHDLADGPFVSMNSLHHQFEVRIEDSARLLRIAVGEQLHRVLRSAKRTGTCFRSP